MGQCSRPVPAHVPLPATDMRRRGGDGESKMRVCLWPALGCRDRAPFPGACTPALGLGSGSGLSRARGLTTKLASTVTAGVSLPPSASEPEERGVGTTGVSPRRWSRGSGWPSVSHKQMTRQTNVAAATLQTPTVDAQIEHSRKPLRKARQCRGRSWSLHRWPGADPRPDQRDAGGRAALLFCLHRKERIDF